MSRYSKVIISATVVVALCDAAFGQTAQTPKAPVHASESMHVGARISEERVNVRSGPSADCERTRLVDKETRVTVTARQGSWVQVTLPSGATGWVDMKFVDPEQALVVPKAPEAPVASAVKAMATAVVQPAPTLAQPGVTRAVQSPPKPAAPSVPSAKRAGDVEKDLVGALSGTKADVLGGARDTPAASAGESFRVLIVLLPILGGIMLAVRGLKSVQQRTGTLPDFRKGLRGAILGGFNLNNARKTGGSSLRVLESIPIGTASLHLVEARGRVLLLGASGGSLSTLADLTESNQGTGAGADSEFQSILDGMSDDLTEDYSDLKGGLGVIVGSLDDQIREARESISRTAVRTRR
jgi:SH3-like domain-containing protein